MYVGYDINMYKGKSVGVIIAAAGRSQRMDDINMYKGKSVGVIIAAAGRSQRMDGINKIWAALDDKPVLFYSLDVFQHHPLIDRMVIVTDKNHVQLVHELLNANQSNKIVQICVGGIRRQDSIAAGLIQLNKCDWVIVHDGARPLITHDLIENGLHTVLDTGAATAAVPVKDTIKSVDANMLVEMTLPRERLWLIQTPQIFDFDILSKAHNQIKDDVTDDASMVEKIGHKVKIFEGSYDNIKITTINDLIIAKSLLKKENVPEFNKFDNYG
jgi:2-C-methyl-D-erythritol 4-phosphate cytidylyltransferase